MSVSQNLAVMLGYCVTLHFFGSAVYGKMSLQAVSVKATLRAFVLTLHTPVLLLFQIPV
jgi:hypothetical protein